MIWPTNRYVPICLALISGVPFPLPHPSYQQYRLITWIQTPRSNHEAKPQSIPCFHTTDTTTPCMLQTTRRLDSDLYIPIPNQSVPINTTNPIISNPHYIHPLPTSRPPVSVPYIVHSTSQITFPLRYTDDPIRTTLPPPQTPACPYLSPYIHT